MMSLAQALLQHRRAPKAQQLASLMFESRVRRIAQPDERAS
jgi:hypothetical protein